MGQIVADVLCVIFIISIHPSRVGWDTLRARWRLIFGEFQSTHPVWDGTSLGLAGRRGWWYFNPPIPCGMGRRSTARSKYQSPISIHPSRVGWDAAGREPGGGGSPISIHPSRVGWDLARLESVDPIVVFQSTHPVWDGTGGNQDIDKKAAISIHPSRVGWDGRQPHAVGKASSFQSTHPVWDGTYQIMRRLIRYCISIHPSRVGWDVSTGLFFAAIFLFQSTHPVWDGTFPLSIVANNA